RVDGYPELKLEAGDIVVFPHGDEHFMGNGAPVPPVDNAKELDRIFSQGLKVSRMGGGGELTRFVCGYMSCDAQICRVVLGGLPPLFKMNRRTGDLGVWLGDHIRRSVSQ